MKRETIESLIPETVENRAAVIDKIMTEAGKDITREQKKFEDYDTIKENLAKATETIEGLKKSVGDADALKQKITEYETKETERAANEAKTAKQREAAQRFTSVKGQHEFIDPDIEDAVMNKFMNAVDDPANKGKGDAEIYTTLTKDKPFFKSQNPPANMGGVGNVTNPDAKALLNQQYEAAVKAGKTVEAVALKNQLFALK